MGPICTVSELIILCLQNLVYDHTDHPVHEPLTLPSTDTLESESARMIRVVEQLSKVEGDAKAMRSLRPRQVKQAVKAVCALLGGLVTLDVQDACEELDKNCVGFDAAKGNEDPAGRLSREIVDEVRQLVLC